MTDSLPWEVSPDLTLERLQVVAENLRDVRHDALEIHDEDKGDDAQVHGTIAYRRSCFRIEKLVESGEYPWLSITDGSRRFIFAIGGTLIRMYRGDYRRPPARSLRSYVEELVHSQLELPFEEQVATLDGWVWRMAIETDTLGAVIRIVVFQANTSLLIQNAFEIPLRDAVTEISPVVPLQRAGTQIPPARVGRKQLSNQEELGDNARAAGAGGEVVSFKVPAGENKE